MDFGTQLKTLRKEKNMTQEQLAEKLGVSRQAVSNWENNKNLPDLEIIIRMSRIFSVTLDDLILGGKDEMNNMTEKLIEDGSENTKLRTALRILAVGTVMMLIGFLCFFLKSTTVEYVDADGILHENFFFIPIGFLFLFAGSITSLIGTVKALISGRRRKRMSGR
ncbi:MAG: helix-turn-helix domain-containing protein [Eubacteriales bacterium]|nr:helix-turn-helix domain-containing protein [Eubacteriales bacterium]